MVQRGSQAGAGWRQIAQFLTRSTTASIGWCSYPQVQEESSKRASAANAFKEEPLYVCAQLSRRARYHCTRIASESNPVACALIRTFTSSNFRALFSFLSFPVL